MRVKQIWHYVPLPAKVKLLWARISASPLTLIYFGFSILHCILQVVFQVQAFMINANAASFLYSLVQDGNATVPGFFVLGHDELHYCADVPQGWSADSCELVWHGTTTAFAQNDTAAAFFAANTTSTSASASDSSSIATSIATSSSSVPVLTVTSSVSATSSMVVPTPKPQVTEVVVKFVTSSTLSSGHSDDGTDDDDVRAVNLHRRAVQKDGQVGVTLNGQGWNDKSVSLSETCLTALNWPIQELDNTKREDVTFIAFQIWVLGMSLVAILNESIPHIAASLLTHLSATGWGAFQIYNTASFHSDFKRLTTDGACDINLLPDYWTARGHAEIPALALNTAALFLSAFLSWRLIKRYGWQTFKRIGASRAINRIYKLVLSLSIAIQLSLFFVVAAVGLWLDQIYHGAIGHLAHQATVYKGVLIAVLVLLTPWLLMGWFAVRRELKVPMMAFLALSILYLAGWGAMFDSTTFRWTFVQWRFFSVIISLSAILTLSAFVLGIFCRMNFGKGLPHYLNAQEELPGDDFVPVMPNGGDPEKVAFPSNNRPIPTFSAAFGSGLDVPPPSQMKFAPRQMGPRFQNPMAPPFELSVEVPSAAYMSSGSPNSTSPLVRSGGSPVSNYARPLSRHTSNGSQQSFTSMASSESAKSSRSEESMTGRRWVIE